VSREPPPGEAIDIDKLTKLESETLGEPKAGIFAEREWFLALSCFWML
jgi:hypothetical protein